MIAAAGTTPSSRTFRGSLAAFVVQAALAGLAAADEVRDPAVRGCTVRREGREVRVSITEESARTGVVEIPRFHSPLRAVRWATAGGDVPSIQPEPRHWVVRWKPAASPPDDVILEFEETPLLEAERGACVPAADGSLVLPACHASVTGEKLRYEPQPHKNTVGFWAVSTDVASWEIEVDRAGSYSVGILQGCGAGHGGSTATLGIVRDDETVASVPFTITETGHFQNFRWFDVGTVTVTTPGRYRVTVAPERIAKGALGDIRCIALVPQAAAPKTP